MRGTSIGTGPPDNGSSSSQALAPDKMRINDSGERGWVMAIPQGVSLL